MKLSRRSFLAAASWLAWPAMGVRAANMDIPQTGAVLGEFLWGQARAECLRETLTVLGLGVPQHVSKLAGQGNAWCATLHYEGSRALVVTSGVDALPAAPAVLRGTRGVLRFDGRTWTLDGEKASVYETN